MTLFLRSSYLCTLLFLACGHTLRAQEYYPVQEIDQAKAEARSKHLPIAWLSSPMVYLNSSHANDAEGSPAELTGLALRTLQGQAVIIFQNADIDLPNMPANMVERIETKDEGDNLPNGWHYTAPKIIYTDPDLKTFLGCTLAPDLRSNREAAINVALLHIRHDPQAQTFINASSAAADNPTPAVNPPASPSPSTNAVGTTITMLTSGSFFIYAAGGLVLLIAAMVFVAWRSRA
jgi:hypothetical protein